MNILHTKQGHSWAKQPVCGTKSGSRAYSRIVVQAPRRPFTRSVEFPKVALLAHRTRTRP